MAPPLGSCPAGDLVEWLRVSMDYTYIQYVYVSLSMMMYFAVIPGKSIISLLSWLAPVTFISFQGPGLQPKGPSHAAMAFLCRCSAAIGEAALEDQDAGIQQDSHLASCIACLAAV